MNPDKTAIELWDEHSYDFELWGVRHRIMNQAGFLAALAALAEAEGERWVSVEEKDKLPKLTLSAFYVRYSEDVQISTEEGIDIGSLNSWREDEPHWIDRTGTRVTPTHWQPLPAPPKEKP